MPRVGKGNAAGAPREMGFLRMGEEFGFRDGPVDVVEVPGEWVFVGSGREDMIGDDAMRNAFRWIRGHCAHVDRAYGLGE